MTGLAQPMTLRAALLKRATVDLVRRHGGGEGAATACRVRQQDLSDYGNNNQPARFIPADVIADLEVLGGEPFVTRQLAASAGYVLVKLPDTRPAGKTRIEHIVCLTKEVADVIAQMGTLGEGRSLTRDEIARAAREFDEAMAALAEAKAETLALGDSS